MKSDNLGAIKPNETKKPAIQHILCSLSMSSINGGTFSLVISATKCLRGYSGGMVTCIQQGDNQWRCISLQHGAGGGGGRGNFDFTFCEAQG